MGDKIYSVFISDHLDRPTDIVTKIRQDPEGLGKKKAQLFRVHHGDAVYRYYQTDSRRSLPTGVYEFEWAFHYNCGATGYGDEISCDKRSCLVA